MLAQGEQFTIFIFWLPLQQRLLYACMENSLNGEISTESVYFSGNNNRNLRIYTVLDRLSLKTILRYCPFKHMLSSLALTVGVFEVHAQPALILQAHPQYEL